MPTTEKKVNDLIRKCEAAAMKNEYRCSTVYGVKRLTRSDLDTIVLYCKTYLANGNLGDLMKPMGGISEVLTKAGIQQSLCGSRQ